MLTGEPLMRTITVFLLTFSILFISSFWFGISIEGLSLLSVSKWGDKPAKINTISALLAIETASFIKFFPGISQPNLNSDTEGEEEYSICIL